MNVDDFDITGRKGFTKERAADPGKPGGTVSGYQRDPLLLSLMDRAQAGPGKLFPDGGRRGRCRINDGNPGPKRPGYRGLEQREMGAAKYGHIRPISSRPRPHDAQILLRNRVCDVTLVPAFLRERHEERARQLLDDCPGLQRRNRSGVSPALLSGLGCQHKIVM